MFGSCPENCPATPPFVDTHRAVNDTMFDPLFDSGGLNETFNRPALGAVTPVTVGRPGDPTITRPSAAGATAAGDTGGFANTPVPRALIAATRHTYPTPTFADPTVIAVTADPTVAVNTLVVPTSVHRAVNPVYGEPPFRSLSAVNVTWSCPTVAPSAPFVNVVCTRLTVGAAGDPTTTGPLTTDQGPAPAAFTARTRHTYAGLPATPVVKPGTTIGDGIPAVGVDGTQLLPPLLEHCA